MWADFAEIRSWRETSTAADFGEIGPHFWHHSLFLSDTGPLRADETTFDSWWVSMTRPTLRLNRLAVSSIADRLAVGSLFA